MIAFKEEPNHLKTMIESMTKSYGLHTLPMKGKITFNTIGPLSQGVWILDLGATDYMTSFPKLFNSYVKWLVIFIDNCTRVT